MIIASIITPMLWKHLNITISINLKKSCYLLLSFTRKRAFSPAASRKKKPTLKQPENSYTDGDDKIQSRITYNNPNRKRHFMSAGFPPWGARDPQLPQT